MKKVLIAFLLFLVVIGCNSNKKNTTKLSQLIPKNSSIVLKISDLESFKSDIKNNDFFNKISNTTNNILDSKLLKNLQTINEVLLCVNTINDENHISIITKYNDSLLDNTKIDSTNFHSKIIDSIYFASSSKTLVNSLAKMQNQSFDKLTQTAHSNASFSLFLNSKAADSFGNALFKTNSTEFAHAFILDTNLTSDEININGIAITNSETTEFLDIFKNTIPQENTISQIAPSNNNGFLSFTFNNYDVLKSNIEAFTTTKIDSTLNDNWLHSITEIGKIQLNQSNVIIAKSLDATTTKDGLIEHQNVASTFREIDILEFSTPDFFSSIFQPLVSKTTQHYYTILDDFFVFASNENDLQNIISSYQNGATASKNLTFQNNIQHISDEASLLMVANNSSLSKIASTIFKTDSNINLKQYKFSAIQLVQDDNFLHVNININKNKTKATSNNITEEFNVTLDADAFTTPQFVTNHRTKQEDVIVQDVNNNLYLISNLGKILWKKRLNGNILGKVEQIDIYKNGRLQLVFATPKRVYVIDRNGNDVGVFPLKFQDEITQPLSVFDYDNNKNYRLLVSQNNALLMYNTSGKTVNGFKYQKTAKIKSQPKHFRINGKDYIVFAAGNTMKILNRQGQSRIQVKESIDFSNNSIYLYKNQFTTTSAKGNLVHVNTNGSVSKQSFKLEKNHTISATSKTITMLSENNLTIRKSTFELDFGEYTNPTIFYLNDKIYVSVTDQQTKKIYLFDSLAKLQSNFPVYGNSTIDLKNIDKDNNLEFVTIGESNSIIVYQKN